MKKKTIKKVEKKENKQIVEIHIYIHQNRDGVGGQTVYPYINPITNPPWYNNPNIVLC